MPLCCSPLLQVNERRLLEASSNLEMKAATLRAAQASLSDTEGQLHDELERNTDLSRDNCMMQRQMELLAEDNKQLSKVGDRAAAAAAKEEEKKGTCSVLVGM
jgi:small-conductance mechanosensitive channel